MGTKKHRMTINIDRADVEFLRDCKVFESTNDGIRFAVKFFRFRGIPAIRETKDKEIT